MPPVRKYKRRMSNSELPPIAATSAVSAATLAGRPTLRTAIVADLEFIFGQLMAGALNGHFDRRMLATERQAELRKDLDQIIRSNKRLETALPAEALVLELENGQPIGHVIVTAIKDAEGLELYAMALEPTVRGIGYGRLMLEQVLRVYLPRARTIYARCFPASAAMYELLINSGFEYLFTMRHSLIRVLSIGPKPT